MVPTECKWISRPKRPGPKPSIQTNIIPNLFLFLSLFGFLNLLKVIRRIVRMARDMIIEIPFVEFPMPYFSLVGF
jgi:hypothetical protein